MGQAKARGSFEKRQAEGITKRQEEERERKRQKAEYEASLTPEQKAQRHRVRTMLAMMGGLGINY